ncbi:P0 [Torilis crimson leaf virus]|uniref:P0 n=1 Tax=Torilis crimson leaf virus TaxID=1862685 RepID=A0A6H2MW59_9VIRU|nr:P0 [Torilis crimson leaf virus]
MQLEIQRSGIVTFTARSFFSRLFAYRYYITHALTLSRQLNNVEPSFPETLPRSLLFSLPFIINNNYDMGDGYIRFQPDHLREFVLWGLICGYYPRLNKRGRRGYRATLAARVERRAYLSTLHNLDWRNLEENMFRRQECFFQSAEGFSRMLGGLFSIWNRDAANRYGELPLDACRNLVDSIFVGSKVYMDLSDLFHDTCPCIGYSHLNNNGDLPCGQMDLFTAPYALYTLSADHHKIHHWNAGTSEENSDSEGEGL